MTDKLTSAAADRDRSRDRFRASAAAIRLRLDPNRLRADGTERAREAIAAVPARIGDAARKRPAATAAIISTAALLLLNKPILGVWKRLTKEKDDG